MARVGGDLGLLLADVAVGLRAGWDHDTATDWLRRARDVDAARADAGEAVRWGDESLRYNPLARDEAETVARLTEAHTGLEHTATQLRGITRALADLGAERCPAEETVLAGLADVLEQAGTAVAAYGRAQVDPGARADLVRAHAAAVGSMDRVSAALTSLPSANDPRTLVSIYVDAGRMRHEIAPDGAHAGALPA